MLEPDQESWKGAWRSLGVTMPDEALFSSLLERYAEPHRAYHTLDHIHACLEHLNNVRNLAEHPAELVLALWFHDAVYDIGQPDNEEQSARLARGALEELAGVGFSATDSKRVEIGPESGVLDPKMAGFDPEIGSTGKTYPLKALEEAQVTDVPIDDATIQRIEELILVTKYDRTPTTNDEALMHDIDLAILGAMPERFDQYEEQIRQEYIQVPWEMFCVGRAAILRKFLEQPALYRSDVFRQKFEQTARANLARSVARLRL